jgi:hypothetical protein
MQNSIKARHCLNEKTKALFSIKRACRGYIYSMQYEGSVSIKQHPTLSGEKRHMSRYKKLPAAEYCT